MSRSWLRQAPTLVLSLLTGLLAAAFWQPRDPTERQWYFLPLRNIEWNFGYDTLFYLRGPRTEKLSPSICIVGYDASAGKSLGVSWPLPRRLHAQVVRNLSRDGAKVITFDMLFASASRPEDDKALDQALTRSKSPTVLAARVVNSNFTESKELEAPYYSDALKIDFERRSRLGFVEVSLEEDTDQEGVVRAYWPLRQHQGQWLPSLSAATYLAGTGRDESPSDYALTKTGVRIGDRLVPATGPAIEDAVATDGVKNLPTSYVDFYGGSGAFVVYPYDQVAKGEFAPGTFKDKYVFVGVTDRELTTLGKRDEYTTAYSHYTVESVGKGKVSRRIYGVSIHAHFLNALLQGQFVYHVAPLTVFLAVTFLSVFALTGVRLYFDWRGLTLTSLAFLLYLSATYAAFSVGHVYLPWLVPCVFVGFTTALFAFLERGRLRRQWRGYVSEQYLQAMLRDGLDARPRRVEATVLFGDIRGFTHFTQQHSPEAVVELLNQHFGRLAGLIHQNQGAVDKFLGDGVMATFGATRPEPDHALHAVSATWAMAEATKETLMPHQLAAGFGLHTGPLICGNIGSTELRAFTLIGDVVNVASRIEGLNKLYGTRVLLSEDVVDAIAGAALTRRLDSVRVLGREEPITIYELLSAPHAPVSDALESRKATYEAAWERYQARAFAEAAMAFAALPNDPPAQLLAKRCQHFLSFPPPPNWDGTWQAEAK